MGYDVGYDNGDDYDGDMVIMIFVKTRDDDTMIMLVMIMMTMIVMIMMVMLNDSDDNDGHDGHAE